MNLGINKPGIMKENFAAMFAGAHINPFLIFLTSKVTGFAGFDDHLLPVEILTAPVSFNPTEPIDFVLPDPTNFRLSLSIV